jgi:hypothetical protein
MEPRAKEGKKQVIMAVFNNNKIYSFVYFLPSSNPKEKQAISIFDCGSKHKCKHLQQRLRSIVKGRRRE